jgi:4'-phosphopantetheinyl transferase
LSLKQTLKESEAIRAGTDSIEDEGSAMNAEVQGKGTGTIAGQGNCDSHAVSTSAVLSWRSAPGPLRLASDEIHVWCANLGDFRGEWLQLYGLLSSAERARAERFRFCKDRNEYIISQGMLRIILSRYLEQHPTKIEFCYGRFGKPEIKADLVRERLNFNISHSGGLALYAVTHSCPVGVDVEWLRPIPHFEEIASRFFSPRETETLMALSTECRMEGFFACWTRKEAFLKATGEGISEGLAKVEVTLTPWEEPEILRTTAELKARTEWQLRSFSPAPGYLAAVAFQHRGLVLSQGRVHAPSSGKA